MAGHTADGICFFLSSRGFGKYQLHKRFCFRPHILALKFCPVLFIYSGACLSVQCKYDSVKYSRLSCSCISGNQEKILIGFFKINHRPFSVGTERLHGQFYRSHSWLTPCTVLITFRSSSISSLSSSFSSPFSFRNEQQRSKGSSSSCGRISFV